MRVLQNGVLLQDRYRIDGLLGKGGMGAVYRGTDTRLGVTVAIKQNLFDEEPSPESILETRAPKPPTDPRRDQFEREARLLASLKHQGLPKVTDYFFIPGEGQYLVMDFIDGQDLGQVVRQVGPLREEQAVGFILEICGVLEYLHLQKPPVIHRDIKPANIRITPAGQVVLVDFGVAKLGTGEHTMFGARAVTPGFSPLEQFGGDRPTDERSDIYSLAATLFALLSGKPPPSATERLMGQQPLFALDDTSIATAGLRPILEKAMALKPEDRFQTATEFRRALAGILQPGARVGVVRDTRELVTQVFAAPPTVPTSPGAAAPATPSGPAPAAPGPSGPVPAAPLAGAPAAPAPAAPAAAAEPRPAPTRRPRSGRRAVWGIAAGVVIAGMAALAVFFSLPGRTTRSVGPATPSEPATGSPSPSGPAPGSTTSGVPSAGPTGSPGPSSGPTTTPEPPPEPVTAPVEPVRLLEIGPVTENSIQVSWTRSPAAGFKVYEVYCATTPGFLPSPDRRYRGPIDRAERTQIVVGGLKCGTTYYVKIRVLNQDGGRADSPEMSATTTSCAGAAPAPTPTPAPPDTTPKATTPLPPAPLEPVTLDPPKAIGENGVELSWSRSAARGFRGYEVHYSRQPGFVVGSTTRFGVLLPDAGRTRLVVDGLECGQTWYFRVRVTDENGRAADSGERSVQTTPCPPKPLEAARLQPAGAVSAQSAELSWTRSLSPEFDSYEVHVSTSTGFAPAETTRRGPPIRTAEQTRLVVDGLKCGTTYHARVRTADRRGQTALSDEISFRTAPCPLPDTLVVATAGAEYATIGAALQAFHATRDGRERTILVRPGRYVLSQRLLLGRPVTIAGEGPASGVVLETGADLQTVMVEGRGVVLRNLTIRSASATALSVAGEGTVEGCEIVSASRAGVGLSGRGSLTLRRSRVTGCGEKGILVTGGASCRATGCEITGNDSGVEVRDQATVVLTDCRISQNRASGVYIHDGGTGELNDCKVLGNGLDGVNVRAGTATLRGCSVSANRQFGLSCSGLPGSTLTVADSDLTGNRLKAIQSGCAVTRTGKVRE